jgi:hypothetical protein
MYPHAGGGLVMLRFTLPPPDDCNVILVLAWQLPATLLATLIVYDPAATLVNVGEDWKFVPSIE